MWSTRTASSIEWRRSASRACCSECALSKGGWLVGW
jgi:hypothetical protein